MKSLEFINEESDTKRELMLEYAGIKMFAEKYCRPYLQEIGGFENVVFTRPLYRGIKGLTLEPNTYSKVVNVNQDRKPTDTPETVQGLIDDWFEQHFGVRLRKTSLHCTGRLNFAHSYSDRAGPFIVIPMGEYHYAYSETYKDMYIALAKSEFRPPTGWKSMTADTVNTHFKDKINKFMTAGNYQFDNNLIAAIDSGHEIMLQCKKALVIQQSFLATLVKIK